MFPKVIPVVYLPMILKHGNQMKSWFNEITYHPSIISTAYNNALKSELLTPKISTGKNNFLHLI